MKRYHDEKHIIDARRKKHKQINAAYFQYFGRAETSDHTIDDGQFRKSMRCGGCTRARCQVCHPDKFPKRKPTRQEQQAKQDLKNENT